MNVEQPVIGWKNPSEIVNVKNDQHVSNQGHVPNQEHIPNQERLQKRLGTCLAKLTTGIGCSSAARFIDLTESTRDEVSSSELPLD